jgi:hypothetical protein
MHTAMQAHFAAALLEPDIDIAPLAAPEFATQAQARFAIHRNNVVAGLVAALARGFPAIQRLLGGDYFAAFAAEFVRMHPPAGPVLLEWGEALQAFLDGFAPLAEHPYLGDVARLEWARRCAHHAADAEPLTAAALRALPAEAVGELRLAAHPSVQRLSSPHPVLSLWRAQQDDGDPAAAIDWQPQHVLVFRLSDRVRTEVLTPAIAAWLDAFEARLTLADAAERIDSLGLDAGAALACALDRGLFVCSSPVRIPATAHASTFTSPTRSTP